MNKVNPKYVLAKLYGPVGKDEADKGEYALINDFFNFLKKRKPGTAKPQKNGFGETPRLAETK